jgi:hypothetical protein
MTRGHIHQYIGLLAAPGCCVRRWCGRRLLFMTLMDRRRFVLASAATAVSLKALGQAPTPQVTKIRVNMAGSGPSIPANFVGLSYETQQLADPDFFSGTNRSLIARFKELSPRGVLRIGGNTSDVGWWKATSASKQPPLPPNVVLVPSRPGERPFQELAYSITPEAIRNLRSFLEATGWTCLYGLNLGSSTPSRAAVEAAHVAATLGEKLEYFQLGNEPDLFPVRFRNKATWTVDTYLDEWLAAANAVQARVPSARFGLPDTSGNPAWSSRIADRLSALKARNACPRVAAITHHYYFGGPPANPQVNIDRLLRTDPRVAAVGATTREAAEKLGVVYRMSEGNTCYKGGKPGVSDVMAAALWAADYLLTLASLGYSGVNLHGGGGKAVADSLGGTLPGEALMADPKAPHPRPFYTPIAQVGSESVPEPVFWGMKFAGGFAGAKIVPVEFDPGAVNATAYAAKRGGEILLAVINKDASRSLSVDFATEETRAWVRMETMTARSLKSRAVELGTFSGSINTVEPASAALFTWTKSS